MRCVLLRGAVLWGVVLTGVTEALSLCRALHLSGLLVSWILVSGAVFGWRCLRHSDRQGLISIVGQWRQSARMLMAAADQRVFLLLLCLSSIAVLCAALAAPPNTWDSMTYHMGRVAHWAHNASVANYPTHIPRQLTYAPWAEFAIAQLQILTQGDRFANLVQTGAFIGCLLGVSVIAQYLGANTRGQLFAAVVCASIPMALIQASGTQNDLVVAFWLVCLVVFVLETRTQPRRSTPWLVGGSFGLAILSKFTAYLYGPVFLVWYGGILLSQPQWRHCAWRALGKTFLIAAMLNAGYYARTFDLLARAQWTLDAPGSPSSAAASAVSPTVASGAPAQSRRWRVNIPVRYINQVWDPQALLSNIVRNAALHAVTPWAKVNQFLDAMIATLHARLGVEVSDPQTTYPWNGYRPLRFSLHEDSTGNPLHFVLLLALPWLLLRTRSPHAGLWRRYGALVGIAGVIFCALLKWQPWHSRLHLGLFILSAPLLATALVERLKGPALPWMSILLFLAGLPWLFWNTPRPLLGSQSVLAASRTSLYFANRPELQTPYEEAAALLHKQGCAKIGLVIGGNDWEYPFWALMKKTSTPADLRIEHIEVRNFTRFVRHEALIDFVPCALIMTPSHALERLPQGGRYRREREYPGFSLYVLQQEVQEKQNTHMTWRVSRETKSSFQK